MKALIAGPHALLEPRVAKLAQRGSVANGVHSAAQRATPSFKLKVIYFFEVEICCAGHIMGNVNASVSIHG